MKSAADETFGNKEENIHDVLAPWSFTFAKPKK